MNENASNSHARSVKTRFSAAAETYDSYAAIQKAVAERVVAMIPENTAPERILEVGCGSGQLTRQLMEHFPAAHIDAIDIAARMIAEARQMFQQEDHITWISADARVFSSPTPYPLIASSSSLHWVTPLSAGLANLCELLEPGGRLVFAIMLDETLSELREARLRVAPTKPPRGRLPNAEEVRACLGNAGLDVIESFDAEALAFYSSAECFLQNIHNLGVTGGEVSRSAVPLTRGDLERLKEDYEAHYREGPKGVRATFKILYIHAHKPDAP
jgi:malonyl-CoA O-methyltransferase